MSKQKKITYKSSGVDVNLGYKLVDIIKPFAKKTLRKEIDSNIGSFAALASIPKNYKNITHHLYGFQSSGAVFSTGKWLKLAADKINKIVKKDKVPILVGGTGLYFKAITDGISKIPNIKFSDRNSIRNLHKKIGQKEFYKKLIKLDPISRNKISKLRI